MSNDASEGGELINFLAATVETIRDRVDGLQDRMGQVEHRMGQMVTGLTAIRDEMAAGFIAVRAQIASGEQMTAGFTAVRDDIERLHLRLDTLDRALTTRLDQMDTEISRLRSVVYLLAKNQPELLRLLGPGSSS